MYKVSKINERKIRRPIKSFLKKDDIHKKFQQQCLSRIRKDREKKIWERRNISFPKSDIKDVEMDEVYIFNTLIHYINLICHNFLKNLILYILK